MADVTDFTLTPCPIEKKSAADDQYTTISAGSFADIEPLNKHSNDVCLLDA